MSGEVSFLSRSPAATVDPAVQELVDRLSECPDFFEAVASVIASCRIRGQLEEAINAASKIHGMNIMQNRPLHHALLDFFDTRDDAVTSRRKGQFVELIMDYVGPRQHGLPFSRNRDCIVLYRGQRVCSANHNLDIVFHLWNGDAEQFEAYECKLAAYNFVTLLHRDDRAKLQCLKTVKTFLAARGYVISVAILTLNGDVELLSAILRDKGFTGVDVIGRDIIRSLFS